MMDIIFIHIITLLVWHSLIVTPNNICYYWNSDDIHQMSLLDFIRFCFLHDPDACYLHLSRISNAAILCVDRYRALTVCSDRRADH